MANQDPQPEQYEVVATFDGTASGDSILTNINTFQANNEIVRVYGMRVNITDNAATPANLNPQTADNCDFTVTITSGSANVPSNGFRIRPTWVSNTRQLNFASPILVMFKAPFQVTITANQAIGAGANGRIVTLELMSEIGIQKVAC